MDGHRLCGVVQHPAALPGAEKGSLGKTGFKAGPSSANWDPVMGQSQVLGAWKWLAQGISVQWGLQEDGFPDFLLRHQGTWDPGRWI